MNGFNQIIEVLVFASVGIGLITTYLTINKIWSRKNDKKVADSVSVFASLLGIFSTLPFLIKYGFIDSEYKGAFKAFVSIITGSIFLLIGSGFWVGNNQGSRGFWQKFKQAMQLEKREAGDLVKAILRPKAADKLFKILVQLAKIDNKVEQKEFEFIDTFAKVWNVPFDVADIENIQHQSQEANYIELRVSVLNYLKTKPPVKQAKHLRDILNALAECDKLISEEEKFILEEINSIIDSYTQQIQNARHYKVIIAPQGAEQEDALLSLAPEAEVSVYCGGKGYLVGEYYSLEFAKMICKKYRSLDLFTAIETFQVQTNTKQV